MTNAVILYTGNVGSTPTVDYLRTDPSVFVPVMEEFDEYLFSKSVPVGDTLDNALGDILEALYERRLHPFLQRDPIKKYRGRAGIPSALEAPHILFKWRPFPLETLTGGRIKSLFSKYRVRPLVIRRRSLTEQTIKVYLSEKTYGGRHQQFVAGKMTDAAYAEYRTEQHKLKILLTDADTQPLRELSSSFLARTTRMFKIAEKAFSSHGPVRELFTEDVFPNLVDKQVFDKFFSAFLEAPISIRTDQPTSTRKGGLDLSNCANSEFAFADPVLSANEEKYRNLA